MLTSIRSRRMPALFTRMSSRPNASTACATSRRAPSKSATFSPSATASEPSASISATTVVRRRRVGALAAERAAEVVDDDACARAGERERVLASDSASGAGDDRDLAVEQAHQSLSIRVAVPRPPPQHIVTSPSGRRSAPARAAASSRGGRRWTRVDGRARSRRRSRSPCRDPGRAPAPTLRRRTQTLR